MRIAFPWTGLWLFRHRSFLALAALPIAVGGFASYTHIGGSHFQNELWQILYLGVSFLGLALRAFTIGYVPKGTSSRNTDEPQAETLNTTGMYSLVRHPLYLGNYLAVLGCLMFFHRLWITLAGTGVFMLLYGSLARAEEAFLGNRFNGTYQQWKRNTPAWIPKLTGWKRPELPFSWRTVLGREYTGFFVVCFVFFLFDLVGDRLVISRWQVDGWIALLAAGTLLYAVLRTLKRQTKILQVDGR